MSYIKHINPVNYAWKDIKLAVYRELLKIKALAIVLKHALIAHGIQSVIL